jgi:predicted XRE-type DNA-binding protein
MTPSSGNVFEDLGLPNAVVLDARVRLAVEINRLIGEQQLTQAATAKCLKVSEPGISALKNYKLGGFSLGRLMSFLLALGQDLEVRITHRPIAREPGRIVVRTTRDASTPMSAGSGAAAETHRSRRSSRFL